MVGRSIHPDHFIVFEAFFNANFIALDVMKTRLSVVFLSAK